ncbi:MAG: RlmE family RNA methyltransferase [Pseudomonadota bacterium]
MNQAYQEDSFAREARRRGYRSRSALKLIELDDRFGFLQPGARVLDLGAAPGGWAQVAAGRVGTQPPARVIAVDIKPIEPITGVERYTHDVCACDLLVGAEGQALPSFDVVLSDMAPATSGRGWLDQERSAALARRALQFATTHLAPAGWFVVKIFQGSSETDFFDEVRPFFARTVRAKPKASRSQSKEMFIVGKNYQGGAY